MDASAFSDTTAVSTRDSVADSATGSSGRGGDRILASHTQKGIASQTEGSPIGRRSVAGTFQ